MRDGFPPEYLLDLDMEAFNTLGEIVHRQRAAEHAGDCQRMQLAFGGDQKAVKEQFREWNKAMRPNLGGDGDAFAYDLGQVPQ